MKFSDERKNYILNEYLENILYITDKEYQKKAWIRGEGPDFDEAVCRFCDIGDPILSEYNEFGITESQFQLLKKLRDEFEIFFDKNDWPQEFIDTPEWEKIINLAKEVLKAFDYPKKHML